MFSRFIIPAKNTQVCIKRFVTTIPGGNLAQPVSHGRVDKVTGLWLLGCGGMCFGAVVLGNVN